MQVYLYDVSELVLVALAATPLRKCCRFVSRSRSSVFGWPRVTGCSWTVRFLVNRLDICLCVMMHMMLPKYLLPLTCDKLTQKFVQCEINSNLIDGSLTLKTLIKICWRLNLNLTWTTVKRGTFMTYKRVLCLLSKIVAFISCNSKFKDLKFSDNSLYL